MENISDYDNGNDAQTLSFHAQIQQWVIEKYFYTDPSINRERQCKAFYGKYTVYMHIDRIVRELGERHTLDSLDYALSERLSRQSALVQKEMKKSAFLDKTSFERIAVYQGLRELVKSVAHLFRTQGYIYRPQIAGNPYWPHLLHCVPALATYTRDEHELPFSPDNARFASKLSPTQKSLLRDFQELLMDGNDQEIYRHWQTNAGLLSRYIGPSQRERIALAEQRIQLSAEFHAAFSVNDAKRVFTVYQEMLTMGITTLDADQVKVNRLRDAGRLICLIEVALITNNKEEIIDLYYYVRHFDEVALIPLLLQNSLADRFSKLFSE